MNKQLHIQRTQIMDIAIPNLSMSARHTLQRKCACGQHTIAGGECEGCRRKHEGTLQRAAVNTGPVNSVPPIVHDVLNSPGQPLDAGTRAFMEPHFGYDFSQVRVHTGSRAAESAQAVNALAYTVGRNVVFGTGQYTPETSEGKRLLAHELTHVVQQSTSLQRATIQKEIQELDPTQSEQSEYQAHNIAQQIVRNQPVNTPISSLSRASYIQRDQLGSAVTHTRGSSRFRRISASFDGQDFVVTGDGTELKRVPAESGRPLAVSSSDARACGGSTEDSYKNNPRYVGIADNGPIPEGEYHFSLTEMAVFSPIEQARMLLGGDYTDPFGRSLHGGDWGAGRVPLQPDRILTSRFCGSTRTRSGFFLHGGVMPGSSGCIDIGNDPYSQLIELLNGYHDRVHVSVRYTHPAPEVGATERATGRFMYPRTGGRNPSLGDRLRSLLGGD